MPRFYFDLCNGDGFVEDEEGQDLPDAAAARKAAVKNARSIICDEISTKGKLDLASYIDISNHDRTNVARLTFGDVVQVSY
jgi:hypothetical protein